MTTLKTIRNKPTEAALWNRIRKRFTTNYSQAYRVEAVNTPGFPDIVWVVLSDIVLIELKAGPLKFRIPQKNFIGLCDTMGVTIWVIWQKEIGSEVRVFTGVSLLANSDTNMWDTGEPLEKWITGELTR